MAAGKVLHKIGTAWAACGTTTDWAFRPSPDSHALHGVCPSLADPLWARVAAAFAMLAGRWLSAIYEGR